MPKDNKNHKSSNECISEALENIVCDRAKADLLFTDIAVYIKKNSSNHERYGPVAAKYMDSLIKANEQLVKIANMLKKEEEIEDEEDPDIDDFIEQTQLEEGDK